MKKLTGSSPPPETRYRRAMRRQADGDRDRARRVASRASRVIALAASVSALGCGGGDALSSSRAGSASASVSASSAPASASVAALPLDLPQASSWSWAARALTVSISANGEVFADARGPLGDAEILAAAKQAVAQQPGVRAVVRADRATPYGAVVHVIDLVKQGGIASYALAVEAVGPGRGPMPPPAPRSSAAAPPPAEDRGTPGSVAAPR
jgi:biopolymer transport protein ExbD